MRYFLLSLLILIFSPSIYSCPAFSFHNLTCVDQLTQNISKMKRFELVDRPNYQVLVSEVGPRLRTLVMPYESLGRDGVFTELYCDEKKLIMKKYFNDTVTEAYFLVDYDKASVTQVGEIIRTKGKAAQKLDINITCSE